MSPRALWINGFDFFFYSLEEQRKHIHVERNEKYAKVWLEPHIELAYNNGFTSKEVKFILETIIEYERVINDKWDKHFGGQ